MKPGRILELKSLLHNCSKTRSLRHGIVLHSLLIKMGFSSDLVVSNHLINMYSKCGRTGDARKLFDVMPIRNLVSWSAMISGLNQAGMFSAAILFFNNMDVEPNEHVYSTIFSACGGQNLSELVFTGRQLHSRVLKNGYIGVSFVANSLISMYLKSDLFDNAFDVFTTMDEVNSVSCNVMIVGFAVNGQIEKSLKLFKDIRPDMFSFSAMLQGFSGDFFLLSELHCQAMKFGLDVTSFVGNVILTMYSDTGSIREAEKVFWTIKEHDIISFNTFMAACLHCNAHSAALGVYREMMEHRFEDDNFTLATSLTACSGLGSINFGIQIHARLIRTKPDIDIQVCNALMNMYAKCGSMSHAQSVFNGMPRQNLVSWNTVITGLGNNGQGREAIKMFDKMVSNTNNAMPNSVTFVALLMACNHSGLVSEGLSYYEKMESVYYITPRIEHLACMVDLLGRSGRLEEAEDHINASNLEVHHCNQIVWGSLLSSCRIHGNVVIGERVARRLLQLQPTATSPYVLMANLRASDSRWQGVARARKLLKASTAVNKEPGWSYVEVNGGFTKFTVGDFSHFRIAEIKMILIGLNLNAKKYGF